MTLGSEEYWLSEVNKAPELVENAVAVMPTPSIWSKYVEFKVNESKDALLALFKQGLEETQWHIDKSQTFWLKYMEFLKLQFSELVHDAYIQRLSVPHVQLDQTFSAFSDFVQERNLNYEESLGSASHIADKTRKMVALREKWEYEVKSSGGSLKVDRLRQYLEWELGNKDAFNFARGLFERILALNPADERLWHRYIWHIWVDKVPFSKIKIPADTKAARELIDRAVFCLPNSQSLYATKLRLQPSMEGAIQLFAECEDSGIVGDELLFQFLFSVKQLYRENGISIEDLKGVFEKHIDSLPKLVFTSTLVLDIDQNFAQDMLMKQLKQFRNDSLFWQHFASVNFRKSVAVYKSVKRSDKIYIEFMETKVILDTFTHGTPQEIEKAYSLMIPLQPTKKRQLDISEEPAVKRSSKSQRDREHASIVVQGDISVDELHDLLKNLKVVSVTGNKTRIIELGTKSEKMLALSRLNFAKKFSLNAYDAENTTLWVNNYPPYWHDSNLKTKFSEFGTVLDLRIPSHEKRERRRFCYVQYSTAQEAATAVEALDGQNGLEVRFSDPSQRRSRTDALEEGREVLVRGLPFSMSGDNIEVFVKKYSNPSSIRVPPGRRGQSNDGFAFLDFDTAADAANAAEALSDKFVSGRKLSAVVASRQKASKPKQSTVNTLSVRNYGTSKAELLELLGEFGTFDVQDDNGGLKVTYTKIQDAGRALLGLDGRELNGQKLAVRNLAERGMKPRTIG
ncbi:hypothetical protein B9G98_02649 [Wickerhamiella sorbophila]|uniref:RRM domain-containing protein n=1 Tax=Wickerhamiella sorbophila TaxID=45607 RepID=A0A2T0FJB4_9ASCO|nr:hypothetical protein B9G98_02649 [Wickerhamiella sorbophila]PRT55029.1 hypothetical protein B9G98_02649 [Wickerhamiella sorbophila]